MASSSSKSKRHGDALLDLAKMERIAASEPPNHLSRMSDARIFKVFCESWRRVSKTTEHSTNTNMII